MKDGIRDILEEAHEQVVDGDFSIEAIELIQTLSLTIESLRDKLKEANYRLESAGKPMVDA